MPLYIVDKIERKISTFRIFLRGWGNNFYTFGVSGRAGFPKKGVDWGWVKFSFVTVRRIAYGDNLHDKWLKAMLILLC